MYNELPRITTIEPLPNYQLRAYFIDGVEKVYDCSHLLDRPVFKPLKNLELFNSVYLDFGVPTWKDGEIDISPETIYIKGVNIEN